MNKSVIGSGIFSCKSVKSVKVTWVWKIKLDLHLKAIRFRCIKMIFESLKIHMYVYSSCLQSCIYKKRHNNKSV